MDHLAQKSHQDLGTTVTAKMIFFGSSNLDKKNAMTFINKDFAAKNMFVVVLLTSKEKKMMMVPPSEGGIHCSAGVAD